MVITCKLEHPGRVAVALLGEVEQPLHAARLQERPRELSALLDHLVERRQHRRYRVVRCALLEKCYYEVMAIALSLHCCDDKVFTAATKDA